MMEENHHFSISHAFMQIDVQMYLVSPFHSNIQVHCLDVAVESTDIAKAITEYVSHAAIETLVLGTPSRSGFMRYFCSP
jgi:K+-sensing histidine kinase KdpD